MLLGRNPQISQEPSFYQAALVVDGKLEESLSRIEEGSSQGFVLHPAMKAIVLNRLGRTEHQRRVKKRTRSQNLKFTQAQRRELFFYSDATIVERVFADLASLGLPEKRALSSDDEKGPSFELRTGDGQADCRLAFPRTISAVHLRPSPMNLAIARQSCPAGRLHGISAASVSDG